MKNLISALACFLLLATSCQDPCDDIQCGANGSCDDGTCICDTGYEGDLCNTLIIDKYTGTWNSTGFQCDGDTDDLVFVIEQGATITDIQLYEIEDPEILIKLNYNGTSITIPFQEFEDGFSVEGSGNINADGSMSLLVNVTEDGFTFVCSGILTKQ